MIRLKWIYWAQLPGLSQGQHVPLFKVTSKEFTVAFIMTSKALKYYFIIKIFYYF